MGDPLSTKRTSSSPPASTSPVGEESKHQESRWQGRSVSVATDKYDSWSTARKVAATFGTLGLIHVARFLVGTVRLASKTWHAKSTRINEQAQELESALEGSLYPSSFGSTRSSQWFKNQNQKFEKMGVKPSSVSVYAAEVKFQHAYMQLDDEQKQWFAHKYTKAISVATSIDSSKVPAVDKVGRLYKHYFAAACKTLQLAKDPANQTLGQQREVARKHYTKKGIDIKGAYSTGAINQSTTSVDCLAEKRAVQKAILNRELTFLAQNPRADRANERSLFLQDCINDYEKLDDYLTTRGYLNTSEEMTNLYNRFEHLSENGLEDYFKKFRSYHDRDVQRIHELDQIELLKSQ